MLPIEKNFKNKNEKKKPKKEPGTGTGEKNLKKRNVKERKMPTNLALLEEYQPTNQP